MRIIIEHDDGRDNEIFDNVTDLFVAVRQIITGTVQDKPAFVNETRSHSWGPHVRELTKEVQQALVELQDFLRSERHERSG